MTPSNRRALVLALGAVALCLLVVSLLVRPHDEAPPSPTTAPTPTAATTKSPATAPAVADGGVAAPAVVANPTAGAVEFRWSSPASTSTDTYLVHVGPTAEEAEIADPISLAEATYSVKSASGTSVCLIAMVVRSGQTSPESAAVCGTAR